MSKQKDDRRWTDLPLSRGEIQREHLVQMTARKWQLDAIAEKVLREVLAQCSIRDESTGKFHVEFPHQLALDQQVRIAKPLRETPQEGRKHVLRQLEGIAGVGTGLAKMVRVSLANPLVALAGKSPFDRYLAVCRNSGMHWGIVRALQHLRDAITVTEERFFTNPAKRKINWRLHLEQISPAMLKRVEECLRGVDARAIHEPACNRWINGIQGFFDTVKGGTFHLPTHPAAVRLPSTSAPPAAGGEAAAVPACVPSPPPAEGPDNVAEELRGYRAGLRALRKHLSPQYLDLAPDDFAALCRFDQDARDFAQGLGRAIEQFSVHCLGAVRQKFIEGCAARAPGNGASPEDCGVELGKCVRQLAEEAASFRSWLEAELPQGENSVGGRLLALVESSLVSGLFLLLLQQRFAELFRDTRDADCDDSRRRAEAKAAASRRLAIVQEIEASLAQQRSTLPALAEKAESPAIALDVAKCCEAALAGVVSLLVLAARGERWDVPESSRAMGKLAHRFLSAESSCVEAQNGPRDYMELVDFEPGVFPPVRCWYFQRGEENKAVHEQAQACRFSRRGGVALSPDIAVPVSVLFGEESRLARVADFLGAEADRHLAGWRDLARASGIRQCLPYVENHGAQLARIQIRDGGSGGHVTLLALPTAAMAMSDDFAENIAVPQAIEQSREGSPSKESLLRAVDAYWREKGIAPGDYSLCVLGTHPLAVEQDAAEAEDDLRWRRRVRRFLNQKARWPLEQAEEILKALGIVIGPKEDGAPHGKVRLGDRHHTLSSKLLKDGQVYATYLYEWIHTLGQERLLADLLGRKDPRLAPYMRKADGGAE